jgi:hypothetical protein
MLRKLAFGVAAAFAIATTAHASTITFVVSLDGAQEVTSGGVPNQGDPDGSATATLTFDDVALTVSWSISVANLDPIVGAHIHNAAAGTNGPIVIDFAGQLTGTALADPDIAALLANPTQFYVNIHTTTFQNGAIRGQIGAPVPEPAVAVLLAASAAALALFARLRR